METARVLPILGLAVAVMFTGACAAVGGMPAVPLPKEIKIEPPSPETPKEIASCSGAWGGWWRWTATGNTTETALIVESIDSKGALVVYSRGVGADGSQGWWSRFLGYVEEGSIVLRRGGIVRTFTCKGNRIDGTYEQGGRTTGYATLTKFELTEPAAKAEPAAAVETTADPITAEKLIAGSPFAGTVTFPTGTFEVEFSFSKDERGLKGALTRTTSTVARPGPLISVEVKKGEVRFVTEIGVEYLLSFENGNLVGKARSAVGEGQVKLSTVKH